MLPAPPLSNAGASPRRARATHRAPYTPSTQTLAARLLRQAFGNSTPNRTTLERLAEQLQCHRLDKGPVTEAPSGSSPSWWLVLEGQIAVGRPGNDGDTVENRLVHAGQWLDLSSAWLGQDWMESAVCLTPVTVAAVPLSTLLECAREDDQLLLGMGQAMAERVRQLSEGRHELATKDVLSRLALWLLRQPREQDGGACIRLPVQKRSIARQLVMAQATLSRSFRRLVELGCIEMAGYTVTIRDLGALRALAGEHSPQN